MNQIGTIPEDLMEKNEDQTEYIRLKDDLGTKFRNFQKQKRKGNAKNHFLYPKKVCISYIIRIYQTFAGA